MPLEGRRLHMGAWCEETPSAYRGGLMVATKLNQICQDSRFDLVFLFYLVEKT